MATGHMDQQASTPAAALPTTRPHQSRDILSECARTQPDAPTREQERDFTIIVDYSTQTGDRGMLDPRIRPKMTLFGTFA